MNEFGQGEYDGRNDEIHLDDGATTLVYLDEKPDEGPVHDDRLIELVQAMSGCTAGDAEYALAATRHLEGHDPFRWCTRAVVRLRHLGLA